MSNIRALVQKHRHVIEEVLPKGERVERVVSLALAAARKNPKLQQCDGTSLLGALVQCVQLGLDPGINAHLVPFYNKHTKRTEVQFIPDYRGLMALVRRSGMVTVFDSACVYEGDHFEYQRGTSQYLHHVQRWQTNDPTKITHVWAMARFPNGDAQFDVMSREMIERVRNRTGDRGGPWDTDWPEMARKTVARRLCKYLPYEPNLMQAVQADELFDAGVSQDNDKIIDIEMEEPQSIKDQIRATHGLPAAESPPSHDPDGGEDEGDSGDGGSSGKK